MSVTRSQPSLAWSKLAASKWEDAWIERLLFLGPGRLAIFSLPGSRRIRIEAYALSKRDAARLKSAFGGSVRRMKPQAALLARNGDSVPLLIRNRLVVVRSQQAAAAAARSHPDRPQLIIPAAMAFGTGDHATTATCLRILCDFAATRANAGPWEALDLGTGTGILALAARLLGASRCDAWDFDPASVRAARDNARLNHLRGVTMARVDVAAWIPSRQWDLVTANLFSQLLIKVSARIADAVKPGGRLILSGMLGSQAEETLSAFHALGIGFQRVVKKGKWVSALSSPV